MRTEPCIWSWEEDQSSEKKEKAVNELGRKLIFTCNRNYKT